MNSKSKSGRQFWGMIVEPYKQLKFGFYLLLSSLTFLSISAYVLIDSYFDQYQSLLSLFPDTSTEEFAVDIIQDIFVSNMVLYLSLLVGLVLTHLAITVYLTHRYYGPIVAIRRFVAAVKEGDLSARVTLRKNDELKELARDLNEMAETLDSAKQ